MFKSVVQTSFYLLRIPPIFCLFFHFFLIGFQAQAQAQENKCNCSILESKNLYNVGLFKELRERLNCCLNNPNKGIQNNAREILALVAIAQDDLIQAEQYITEMVRSNINYQPMDSNLVLLSLFQRIKRENAKITVSSVSKKPEDIRTAPASVLLITADQIKERGYMDIVDILTDIPGFDISRLYSTPNTNIYQLGFRQDITERTLFMVDGIEENDVWSNYVYASTQYPINNIKAVEILYGPASTMYGARAFVGTVNIITYSPKERGGFLSGNEENQTAKWYSNGRLSMGSYNTKDLDMLLGYQSDGVNIQFTARINQSDGHDMSDEQFFNYDVNDLDVFQYDHIQKSGKTAEIETYLKDNEISIDNDLLEVSPSIGGDSLFVRLSQEGKDRAKELDRKAYTSKVNGADIAYSNTTMNYFVGCEISFDKFILGFRAWKRKEGYGNYHDLDMAPSDNGSIWAPENKTAYLKYDRNIGENFSLSILSTFKHHRLGDETSKVSFMPFGNPNISYDPRYIVNYSSLLDTNFLSKNVDVNGNQSFPNIGHGWKNKYFFYQGTQGRNELRIFYDTERLTVMGGAEFRVTSSQGDYLSTNDFNWRGYESPREHKLSYFNLENNDITNDDYFGNAQSKGTAYSQTEGSNIFLVYDFGAFAQLSYEVFENKFYVVGGLRFDSQKSRVNSDQKSGFTDLLPRIGLIYNLSDRITLKVNAAEGYQGPSLWTKYSTGTNRVPNPRVKPERIEYIDFSITDYGKVFNWNITAFAHKIEDAISSKRLPISLDYYANKDIHVNVGEYDIKGLFAQFGLKWGGFHFYANGTYTSGIKSGERDIYEIAAEFPGVANFLNSTDQNNVNVLNAEIQELSDVKDIADIANIKANAGVTKSFNTQQIFTSINLRANYVGKKKVGFGTTVPTNPGVINASEGYVNTSDKSEFRFENASIPSYFVINGNLLFDIKALKGVRLGLQMRNILNQKYYHPGPAQAGATIGMVDQPEGMDYRNYYSTTSSNKHILYVPQMLQNYTLSLLYSF
tara:strand:+ start:97249 stop:100323 length:3075 start_codon:yes stop_codon:yes gene_type:complete